MRSSRDADEASANRRLSGQHMEVLMARQRHLESTAETEKKRVEKVSRWEEGSKSDPALGRGVYPRSCMP